MWSPAGACVAPHLRCLRWVGFCRLSPGTPRYQQAAHYLYRLFALASCSVYLAQECVYAYQERADMEKLSRVMFLLLCHVTSLAKQLVFHTDAHRIDTLVAEFDAAVFNAAEAAAALARTARAARWLQRLYSGTAVVTCTLWLVFPVARYARGLPVDFPFWLPAPPDHVAAFCAVLVYSYYVTTLVGIANTTMDAFVGTVLYQCTTQLTVLQKNLETLSDRTDEVRQQTGEDFESVFLKLFYECLSHYNKICEIASLLQDIFGTAILFQFAIGGWILCMAAYKLVSLNVLSVEFVSMNLFVVCILTELFLYCYYGNELTYESQRLQAALYACGWERSAGGRRARRGLLLARERAQRPLRAAAWIVPLSLDTFLKIIKSSYTFYAVLRQTK
ncbi:odorant receptor 4-like [Pectinophora gossypiella]|uniref:odorant receptor 4-like n=1 Tax=Pectinophora gossypiella TaxID=13191 RepID=UPI00214E525B|nr:odorant receptor 4-like [Pectinophora gossypiella]